MGYTKDQLLRHLKEHQIDFVCYEHPAVLTVEAQAKHVGHLGGGLSKNLLLKDKKHRFYVVSALASTNIDLKVLSQRLGLGKGGLRMAPEEALQQLLQVPPGCVTPFALINDSERSVLLLLDQGFKAHECCFFHPLSNDMTISLSPGNLDKFLTSIGRKPSYVDLQANLKVGPENAPDLADLVLAEVNNLPDQMKNAVQSHLPADKNTKFTENTCPNNSKATLDMSQSTAGPSNEVTNMSKFVEEIIDKTSAAVLSEINKLNDQKKEIHGSSVMDAVRKRITSDLENSTLLLKNGAYTEGFHAGFQSALPRRYW